MINNETLREKLAELEELKQIQSAIEHLTEDRRWSFRCRLLLEAEQAIRNARHYAAVAEELIRIAGAKPWEIAPMALGNADAFLEPVERWAAASAARITPRRALASKTWDSTESRSMAPRTA